MGLYYKLVHGRERQSYGAQVSAERSAWLGRGGGTVPQAPNPFSLTQSKLRGSKENLEYRAIALGQLLRQVLQGG
jgi:hypothetical protein